MAYDPTQPVWNVMTRTRGGTVSLLKNLTEDEARSCMQRLRRPLDEGDPWSDWATKQRAKQTAEAEEFERQNPPKNGCQILYGSWGRSHTCTDGDLEQIECWGPPGVEMVVWPKPDDYEVRYEAALQAARREVAERADVEMVTPPKAPPAKLETTADVLEAWFADCVAKYDGATETAKNLYDGFSGQTLMRFANNKAPDGVSISQADMERFLDKKGIRSRHAMFAKRYDGIALVIWGSVRSGNYGT